jgi:hypothetical protein
VLRCVLPTVRGDKCHLLCVVLCNVGRSLGDPVTWSVAIREFPSHLGGRFVPASPEFDSGQGARDGRKLDVWRLFQFIY